jgi:hypothetical protein
MTGSQKTTLKNMNASTGERRINSTHTGQIQLGSEKLLW